MKRKKNRPQKLKSLLVGETEDDAALFQAALERLDPHAIKSKLAEIDDPIQPKPATKLPTQEIDLHHCNVAEAKQIVDQVVAQIILGRGPCRLKIITGKGRHSGPKGPILAREIHTYIVTNYANHIVSIEESPADLLIGGVSLRGHFHVVLRH